MLGKSNSLMSCSALSTLLLAVVSAAPAHAKAPDTPQSQRAIEVLVQQWQTPASELEVLSEVKVNDVTRVKVLHPTTGRLESVNLDANMRPLTNAQVNKELREKSRAKDFVGKVEKELADKLNRSKATGNSTIALWAKLPGSAPQLDRSSLAASGLASQMENSAKFHKNAVKSLQAFVEAQGGTVDYQSQHAPLLVVTVPDKAVAVLENRADVDAIYLGREYQPELNVSASAIDANTVWGRGYTGSGVPVAVVEADAIYFGHSYLADGTYCNPTSGAGSSPIGAHATGVAGIIASTNATYKGVANGAPALLSGNARSYGDADIIACTEWAINNGARVINYSFGVDSSSSLVALDRYVDYVVRNRAVTMVKSAGNKSYTCSSPSYNISSPGKGWNIITVGNYRDNGTTGNGDDSMNTDVDGGSCYEDPTSTHGDREKPEVSAPGTNITTTYCTSPSTCTGTGTSFSAPHVVGCAALLMQRNTTLQYWPESIKAILMASAVVNLEGSTRLSEHDKARLDASGGVLC